MSSDQCDFIIVRQLTGSDMGWFVAQREKGRVKSKQRAIHINTEVINKCLPSQLIKKGIVRVHALCVHQSCRNEEDRTLSKVGKNWRLGGRKVPGMVFGKLHKGDLFIAGISLLGKEPFPLRWTVLFKASENDK